MERDILAERVRNGLANAKAKGIRIGRKKIRPSQLIRTLRQSGLTYRKIAEIAKVSSGCIGAEIRCWNKEIAEGKEQVFGPDIPPPEVQEVKKVTEEVSEPPPEPVNIIRY